MALKTENFFGLTDPGLVRTNNEDAFIVQTVSGGRYVLACVIDGVGGYEGGEIAAAIARESITEKLGAVRSQPIPHMKEALFTANEEIFRQRTSSEERPDMACVLTVVMADLKANQFYYSHVGDTRLYLLRDESLVKLTHDHSFVGFLEDNNRISEQEAMNHPKRHEISKALGLDPNMSSIKDYIETGTSPFLPGDLLMLCSDGLSDLVDNSSMRMILAANNSLDAKAKNLIQAANAKGGKDNITVVLLQNNKKPVKLKAMKPVIINKNESSFPPKQEEVPPEATPPPEKNIDRKRNFNSLKLVLFILVLVLIAAIYWQWKTGNSRENIVQPVNKVLSRSVSEQRLIDSLERSPFIFLDASYGTMIQVNDTIEIKTDSVYINGNGIILKGTGNPGSVLLSIPEGSRTIMLENLVIENFDIAVLTRNNNLKLKNVVFRNCRIPVRYDLHLAEGVPVNGGLSNEELFRTDSLKPRE